MATLHFICGKAASGKTTLARGLAARHAAVLFGEDEWLTRLDAEINSLADHVRHSKRLNTALAPLGVRLLQLGVPIVFDSAGNTPNDRAWVRSIFESASADHVLHYIVASDEPCKARLRLRNETKRLTENELSDFRLLWHDGCDETIIEAQDVDRNHSPEV